MRNTILATLTTLTLTLTLTLALAGCGAGADTDGRPSMVCDEDGLTECTVTMRDGRRVPCLVMQSNTYRNGMSCDWAHASGSDEEPTR